MLYENEEQGFDIKRWSGSRMTEATPRTADHRGGSLVNPRNIARGPNVLGRVANDSAYHRTGQMFSPSFNVSEESMC